MERTNKKASIRPYQERDFDKIHSLNKEEGWTNLVEQYENTYLGLKQSNIAFVVESEEEIIGYIRGLTDSHITLYICELLIDKRYRGLGLGKELLKYVHHLYPHTRIEMLASSTSHSYYEGLGFRPFYGYRKTYEE